MGSRPGNLGYVLLLLAAAALVDVAAAVFVDVNGVTRISLGQVTHESCSNHRNGPALAVAKINALNDGRGFALGFDQGTYVSFNLTWFGSWSSSARTIACDPSTATTSCSSQSLEVLRYCPS